jgi:hypothetical protein
MKIWVVWRAVKNEKGEEDKVPWRTDGIGRLSWSNSLNWMTFDQAKDLYLAGIDLPDYKGAHFAGIGFIVPARSDNGSSLSVIDLDSVMEDGKVKQAAMDFVNRLDSYTEFSPSGKGIHIITLSGNLHEKKNLGRKDGKPIIINGQEIEAFVHNHFVTFTGAKLEESKSDIYDRTEEYCKLYKEVEEAKENNGNWIEQMDAHQKTEEERRARRYVEKALEYEAHAVRTAKRPTQNSKGARNNTLNDAALKIGGFVPKWLSQRELETALLDAAVSNGMDKSSALATIRSGMRAGMKEPRDPNIRDDALQFPSTAVIPREQRIRVTLGSDLAINIEDSLEALYENNNPPIIFQRTGALCRVKPMEDGRYKIEELTDYALRTLMSQSAIFEKLGKNGYEECRPPMDLARGILAMASWDFPVLRGVISSPVMRPDGSILMTSGYDTATGLFYTPDPGLILPEIPPVLNKGDAEEAARFIHDEVLRDFPFVDKASEANTLAAFLSPVIRPMIDGCVPMALVDKPAPGTGASKIIDLISIVATGRPMAALSPPKDDDEWRKLITGNMRDGSPLICLDNIASDLKADSLARALSSSIWKDRTLGKPDATEYPQKACWYATGNNLTLNGDIPRRSYLIQLDAKMARPWERTTFKHPDINRWVKENRGLVLSKLLIMAASWASNGRSSGPDKVIGGFDAWVGIAGGILLYSGANNFLGNLDKLYLEVDSGNDEWAGFFAVWLASYKSAEKTVSDVLLDIKDSYHPLNRVIPVEIVEKIKYNTPGDARKIGILFRKKLKVRYRVGEKCIMLTQNFDKNTNGMVWKVLEVKENESA